MNGPQEVPSLYRVRFGGQVVVQGRGGLIKLAMFHEVAGLSDFCGRRPSDLFPICPHPKARKGEASSDKRAHPRENYWPHLRICHKNSAAQIAQVYLEPLGTCESGIDRFLRRLEPA